jgi:hypothetical protein
MIISDFVENCNRQFTPKAPLYISLRTSANNSLRFTACDIPKKLKSDGNINTVLTKENQAKNKDKYIKIKNIPCVNYPLILFALPLSFLPSRE